MKKLISAVVLFASVLTAFGQLRDDPSKYWDMAKLKNAPAYRDAGFPDSEYPGLRSILYDGITTDGKAKKLFAYIGIPSGPVPKGGFPGLVIAHGGLGTAFGWVAEYFMKRGYVVICMDWKNQRPVSPSGSKRKALPGGEEKNHEKNAVANVSNLILAHSLLLSLPQVDKNRTAYIGSSWGSWYGVMAASADPRFKLSIQLFCGDYGAKAWGSDKMINGRFLHAAKCPMYWLAGAGDQNVTPVSLNFAWQECPKLWNKSLIMRLPHSVKEVRSEVISRVLDHFFKGGPELPLLGKNQIRDGIISAPLLKVGKGVKKAFLCYTCDTVRPAYKRKWQSIPAKIEGNRLSARIPQNTVQCYLTAYDSENLNGYCCGSGELWFKIR